ncbi:hypothetical protein CALVIDRAFT_532362 [Calocera viscosa TUFC12733]|uniref:Uncharacterized protein n=1 Tax=Calocera viscosa (strain TUFC12733) TaxID=1330018 RepID=A0A167S500_CALVF|nr:hypothetical protein CALVIDRAFT_532362 [Calocera viscosa TUFC12733]
MDPDYDEDPDLFEHTLGGSGDTLSTLAPSSTSNSLAGLYGGESLGADSGSGGMSLAYELAAALAPEPGANAKALAEELGLEFDEDEGAIVDPFADQGDETIQEKTIIAELPVTPPRSIKSSSRTPTVVVNDILDPADALNRDAKALDAFILSLKTAEPTQSEDVAYEATVEDWISDLLRRLRTTTRDRDMQVKQFEQISRDLRRKIDPDVEIPEIPIVDGWLDGGMKSLQVNGYNNGTLWSPTGGLGNIPESPDDIRYNDHDDGFFSTSARHSRTTSNAVPSDPIGAALSTLSAIHTSNNDLITLLSSLSDQAQVNGAANADAARQLRLIRNRLTGLRDEWESVERSRLRIQRWESGDWAEDDMEDPPLSVSNSPSVRSTSGPGTPRTPPNRPSAKKLADEAMQGYTASMEKASRAAEALRSAVGISLP